MEGRTGDKISQEFFESAGATSFHNKSSGSISVVIASWTNLAVNFTDTVNLLCERIYGEFVKFNVVIVVVFSCVLFNINLLCKKGYADLTTSSDYISLTNML